jgi:cytochrome c553
MQRVADYYSKLKPPASRPVSDAAGAENGRIIATQGLADVGIPPCLACHGPQALPTYPRLAGQQAAYMKAQLRLWRNDINTRTPTGAIMAPIARLLNDRQIEDVSTFFESLRAVPANHAKTGQNKQP